VSGCVGFPLVLRVQRGQVISEGGSTHISAQLAPRSAMVACGIGRLSCDARTSRRNFSSGCPVSAKGDRARGEDELGLLGPGAARGAGSHR